MSDSLTAAALWVVMAETLVYGGLAARQAWRDRRMVTWDYQRQQWRAAGLVMEERAHGTRRAWR